RVEVDGALVDEAVQRERGDALRRRVDVRERVAPPGPRALRVLVAAPEVDDGLALERHADGRADLVAGGELAREGLAHALESRVAAAVDRGGLGQGRTPTRQHAPTGPQVSIRRARLADFAPRGMLTA